MKNRELTSKLKAVARSYGVPCNVRSNRGITTVTVKAPCPDAMLDEMKALETNKAHGDIMDDTRWYSGQMVTFRFDFALPDGALEKVESIIDQWTLQIKRDKSNSDFMSTKHHIEKDIKAMLGRAVADVWNQHHSLWGRMTNINEKREVKNAK